MKIKICGITNLDDALMCIDAGADALGFNFHHESKRFIDPEDVRSIIDKLPPFITKVGIFVNELIGAVKYIKEISGVDTVQFHGMETPEYCNQFKDYSVIKVIQLGIKKINSTSVKLISYKMREYNTKNILLDSGGKALGGTGNKFDWEILRDLKDNDILKEKNIILAGGLNPENIEECLKNFNPYAVDVASGVESSPGIKDKDKVIDFINKVKNAS